jgi:uncharacterized membrane protein
MKLELFGRRGTAVRINRAAVKNNARTRLITTRPSPLAVAAVYVLVSYILSLLRARLDGSQAMMDEWYAAVLANELYLPELPEIVPAGLVLVLLIVLMNTILRAGFVMYSLKICQEQKASFGDLLDGFGMFFKILGLSIVSGIFVFLWSLLLIVPGVVAYYRYSMALYIMIDNPELGILDCLRRSGELTYEYKLDLFVLDLSFIGWYFAATFPPLLFWVTPYYEFSWTNYYLGLRDMPGVQTK